MVTFVILLFTIIVFIFIDLVPLYKQQQWMSFWVYTIFMAIALALAVMIELKIDIPSPAVPIKNFVTALFGPG